MRFLPYLLVVGLAIAGLVWLMQRNAGRQALPAGEVLAAPAVLAFGPESGPGRLRVTATQLVFTADSGRVLTIERLDITGVGTTRDLPDRHTAAPVLSVSTAGDVYYFQLDKAESWAGLLS